MTLIGESDPRLLPSGWTIVPIGSAVELNPRKPATDEVPTDAPVTFVPMPSINADAGAITNPLVRPFSEVRKGFTSFRNEDVILAKITPCFENGKAAICRDLQNGLGFGSTEFHVLRSSGIVLPEYVFHFVRQECFRREGAENMTGSVGQKRVPADWLSSCLMPVPPLAEQRRIVEKVGQVLARIAAARERLAKVPTLLKRFRQSVLAAACSGRLTADWRKINKVDDEWPVVALGSIGTVSGGITKNANRKTLPRQVPYLRVANVYQNELRLNEIMTIGVTDAEFERTSLRRGDLLFVEGNGSIDQVGRVAQWDGSVEGCVHQNHLIRFRAPKTLDPKYAMYAMMSPQGREQLMNHAISSAGLHSLSISKISATELALPTIAEQRQIVGIAESFFKIADKIEFRASTGTNLCQKLVQSTLAKAFRGELVPTEAELSELEGRDYESAEALLKSIRQEHGEAKNNKSTGRHPKASPARKS